MRSWHRQTSSCKKLLALVVGQEQVVARLRGRRLHETKDAEGMLKALTKGSRLIAVGKHHPAQNVDARRQKFSAATIGTIVSQRNFGEPA